MSQGAYISAVKVLKVCLNCLIRLLPNSPSFFILSGIFLCMFYLSVYHLYLYTQIHRHISFWVTFIISGTGPHLLLLLHICFRDEELRIWELSSWGKNKYSKLWAEIKIQGDSLFDWVLTFKRYHPEIYSFTYNRLGEFIKVLNCEKKIKHLKYLSMSETSGSLLYLRRTDRCLERNAFDKILAKVLKGYYDSINNIITQGFKKFLCQRK